MIAKWHGTPEAKDLTAKDRCLPCPFCASEHVANHEITNVLSFHCCSTCGMNGPISPSGLEDSRLRWNTRLEKKEKTFKKDLKWSDLSDAAKNFLEWVDPPYGAKKPLVMSCNDLFYNEVLSYAQNSAHGKRDYDVQIVRFGAIINERKRKYSEGD